MIGFFRDFPHNPFLLTGLVAGLLSALSCGLIGPYILGRRMVLLSGAIAHAAVGGVGLAVYLRAVNPTTFFWFDPLIGAMIVAVFAAVLIAWGENSWGTMPETLLAAMWALGMSVGVLLAKMTPGYQIPLMTFLFGNITYVSWYQLRSLGVLSAAIAFTTLLFHKQFVAFCTDKEQAQLQGVQTGLVLTVLLLVSALAVIVLCQVVGLVMVITLLTLPAATAGLFVKTVGAMMLAGTVLAALLTTVPRIAVYGTAVSAESAIVLAAVGTYLVALCLHQIGNKCQRLWRKRHVSDFAAHLTAT